MFIYTKATMPTSFGQDYSFHMREPDRGMVSFNLCMEVLDWCTERFGPQSPLRSGARWDHGGYTFFFRDEADAFHFRMRWC